MKTATAPVICSVPHCGNPAFTALTGPHAPSHALCKPCYEEITAFYERAKASIEKSSPTLTGVKK